MQPQRHHPQDRQQRYPHRSPRHRPKDDRDGPVLGTASFTRIERGPLERASLGASVDLDHQGHGLVQEAIDESLKLESALSVGRMRLMHTGLRKLIAPRRSA